MAKRKINASIILAAGDDAYLKINNQVSHAKYINGEKFLEIYIDEIQNNPTQPRIYISKQELENLMYSIKTHGLIQPISVLRTNNKYILKAGQRRLLAYKKLGLKKIKAIVEEQNNLKEIIDEKKLFEIAVIENTHREQLDPLEFALSLQQAIDKKFYKNLEELAIVLGKSKSYISKVMKILKLDNKIIQDLVKNKSTNDIESLYEIQKINNKSKQISIYFDFINKKINRNNIREITKKQKNNINKPYSFKLNNKIIKLNIDISKLSTIQKNNLNKDLKEILTKYF